MVSKSEVPTGFIPLGEITVQAIVGGCYEFYEVVLALADANRQIRNHTPKVADHLLRRVFVNPVANEFGYYPGDEPKVKFAEIMKQFVGKGIRSPAQR